jgi:hypothetical protein
VDEKCMFLGRTNPVYLAGDLLYMGKLHEITIHARIFSKADEGTTNMM